MAVKDIKLAIQNELPAVFAVFASKLGNGVNANSMDELYVTMIQAHHNVTTSGKYNSDYIAQHRQETKKGIAEMKLMYLDKAKEVIQQLKEKYTEQPQKKGETADSTTKELQRSNNLILWTAQLPVASINELRELYAKHKDDEDFMVLLNVEIKKRDSAEAKALLVEIENPSDNGIFNDLNKVEQALTFCCKNRHYPHGLTNGISNIVYRNIDEDLDAYPIVNGPTYRPVFSLPTLK